MKEEIVRKRRNVRRGLFKELKAVFSDAEDMQGGYGDLVTIGPRQRAIRALHEEVTRIIRARTEAATEEKAAPCDEQTSRCSHGSSTIVRRSSLTCSGCPAPVEVVAFGQAGPMLLCRACHEAHGPRDGDVLVEVFVTERWEAGVWVMLR